MPTDDEIKAQQAAKDQWDKANDELGAEITRVSVWVDAAALLGKITSALRHAGADADADVFERSYQALSRKISAEQHKINGKQKALNISNGATTLAGARNLIEDGTDAAGNPDSIKKEKNELASSLARAKDAATAGNIDDLIKQLKEIERVSLEIKGKEVVKGAFF